MDSVERDYERAILGACQKGDDSHAFELSIGLKQYRELYKDGLFDIEYGLDCDSP